MNTETKAEKRVRIAHEHLIRTARSYTNATLYRRIAPDNITIVPLCCEMADAIRKCVWDYERAISARGVERRAKGRIQ